MQIELFILILIFFFANKYPSPIKGIPYIMKLNSHEKTVYINSENILTGHNIADRALRKQEYIIMLKKPNIIPPNNSRSYFLM